VVDYPLIGEVKLNGLTLAEAEAELDNKLRGDYLINPRITISIDEYRPFFISGAVNSPGSYEYVPGMTAMQAVVIAGGFTERASKRKVYVTRENDPAATSNKVNLNEKINAGDTVTVKETFF
jgi:polysaccharide export outer membrane protein